MCFEPSQQALWQRLHDLLIGVIDHGEYLFVRNTAVKRHSVPMPLVHMVSWLNCWVSLAQFNCPFGITLQVHCRRVIHEVGEQEDLTADFEGQDVFPEGKLFPDLSRLLQAILPDEFEVHERIVGAAILLYAALGCFSNSQSLDIVTASRMP